MKKFNLARAIDLAPILEVIAKSPLLHLPLQSVEIFAMLVGQESGNRRAGARDSQDGVFRFVAAIAALAYDTIGGDMKREPESMDQVSEPIGSESPGHRLVQLLGYVTFFVLMAVLLSQIVGGYGPQGSAWLVIGMVVAGYLIADLMSGVVHFLADNFGSPDMPLIGASFVLPFRQHHDDPQGILRHGFFATNGNNVLVCLVVLIPVVWLVPVETSVAGYAAGVFAFSMLTAVLLTNQVHKWAHMDVAPPAVRWLQRTGIIISKPHHDIHHTRPFNSHYCIAVGAWNPLFERWRVPDRVERLIRRCVPGTDPRLRIEQDRADQAARAAAMPSGPVS